MVNIRVVVLKKRSICYLGITWVPFLPKLPRPLVSWFGQSGNQIRIFTQDSTDPDRVTNQIRKSHIKVSGYFSIYRLPKSNEERNVMRKIGQMSGDDSQGITLMQYVRVYKLLLVYRSFCTPTRSLFQFAPDKCNNGPKFSVRFMQCHTIITSVDYYVDCWSNTTMRRNLILLLELWMRACIQIDLKFNGFQFNVARWSPQSSDLCCTGSWIGKPIPLNSLLKN